MAFLVVRVRGTLRIKPDIKETLKLLRLNQVNHCVVLPETNEYRGMLMKAKDYITWGEVDKDILGNLIRSRGRIEGGSPVTDEVIKARSTFKNIDGLAEAIVKGEVRYKDLEGIKPIFRLAPPIKGGYEGLKRHYTVGGALGYRGKAINDLVTRMM